MKYFLILAFLISVAATVSIIVPLAPKIKNDINMFLNSTSDAFPQDLEITIKEGKLSLNKEEPYVIPFTNELTTNDPKEGEIKFKNLLVIDPKGTIEDLEKYETVILINELNVITRSESGEVESYPLAGFPDKVFSRANLENFSAQLRPLINVFLVLIALLVLVGMMIYNIIFRMIYLVIPALVFMIVGNIRGLKLNFAQNYQIAIHSMTLPLIADVSILALRINIPLPLWFFALHILFGMVVIYVLTESNQQD